MHSQNFEDEAACDCMPCAIVKTYVVYCERVMPHFPDEVPDAWNFVNGYIAALCGVGVCNGMEAGEILGQALAVIEFNADKTEKGRAN